MKYGKYFLILKCIPFLSAIKLFDPKEVVPPFNQLMHHDNPHSIYDCWDGLKFFYNLKNIKKSKVICEFTNLSDATIYIRNGSSNKIEFNGSQKLILTTKCNPQKNEIPIQKVGRISLFGGDEHSYAKCYFE